MQQYHFSKQYKVKRNASRRMGKVLPVTATVAVFATVIAAVCSLSCKKPELVEVAKIEPKTAETVQVVSKPLEVEPVAPVIVEEKPVLYDVPLSEDLQQHIVGICEEKNIEPTIALAMIYKESRYQADVVGDGGNSFGLMQVQPKWHSKRMERLGVTDLLDPFQNVTVALDLLGELLNKYDGEIEKAIVAYNQGSFKGTITDYAEAVLKKAGEINEVYA